MKKFTLLLFTLLFIVSCVVGMRAAGFMNFSNKNADLIKENPVQLFINNKPEKVALTVPDSSRFTRIVLAQGFDDRGRCTRRRDKAVPRSRGEAWNKRFGHRRYIRQHAAATFAGHSQDAQLALVGQSL